VWASSELKAMSNPVLNKFAATAQYTFSYFQRAENLEWLRTQEHQQHKWEPTWSTTIQLWQHACQTVYKYFPPDLILKRRASAHRTPILQLKKPRHRMIKKGAQALRREERLGGWGAEFSSRNWTPEASKTPGLGQGGLPLSHKERIFSGRPLCSKPSFLKKLHVQADGTQ
jgi:hypothetical protein